MHNVNVGPSWLILVILMMEAIRPSEMSVLTSATQSYIPEGDILHSHSREEPQILQRGTLSPLLFHLTFEYANRKVQGNQVGLKLNGTHQLLAYADDVNLLGDDIDTLIRTQAL
jgi:hypothetical protein